MLCSVRIVQTQIQLFWLPRGTYPFLINELYIIDGFFPEVIQHSMTNSNLYNELIYLNNIYLYLNI